MRKRRQQLQVSTFPFLAVLLCAMGALILLLLVIDRRAKVVARNKAVQASAETAARQAADRAKIAAERQAESERRQNELHALLARLRRELEDEERQLSGQLTVQTQELDAEQARRLDLRRRLAAATSALTARQTDLAAQRVKLDRTSTLTEATQTEIARQEEELAKLEQALRDLKALRQRGQQTYSVVPYHGKRGDNRQPVYVECTASGLIFHPDRFMLDGLGLSPLDIRAEVGRRIARLRPDPASSAQGEPPAYLLMLVRPDGIMNYHLTQAALRGLNVQFGYELIDADWILDFAAAQEGKAPSPWKAASPTPAPVAATPPPVASAPGARPQGYRFGDGEQRDNGAGTAAGEQKASVSPAVPSAGARPQGYRFGDGGLRGDGAGTGAGEQKASVPPGSTPRGLTPPARQDLPGGTGPGQGPALPSLPGAPTDKPSFAGRPAAPPSPAAPGAKGGGPVLPQTPSLPEAHSTQPPGAKAGAAVPGAGSTKADAALGEPAASRTPADAPGQRSADASGAPGAPSESREISGPPGSTPTPVRKPPVLLSRLTGNRDWVVYVECKADEVVLRQAGMRFVLNTLAAPSDAENPLVKAVRQLVSRRQAAVRPGEPPYRPMIRFQVYRGGLRAYYLSYPLLEALRLPMSRENIE